jgi:glycosyltransferase involved in cell wall biosynthesis
MLSRRSFQRASLSSAAMQATLDAVLAANDFDIVQVESSQMCGFNFGPRATIILDEHNIEYELLYRTYKTERSPLRKLFNLVEYRKFRTEEQRSWQSAAACVLTSPREELILHEHAPQTRTLVVPNGVDVDYFQADQVDQTHPIPGDGRAAAPSGAEQLVFVGVMHYRPNVDAAMYFIREVLPHIVRERPRATFTIVGGGAPEELRRLAGPNVVFTDVVPDTRPYVGRAAVVVVPIRMGSGTRLKVLEGLAMSRPMVSTSLGCEGIAAEHGKHLLVADQPVDFARSVLRILDDPALGQQLGRHGRELAERTYSWPSVLRQLELLMLAQSHPQAATPAA